MVPSPWFSENVECQGPGDLLNSVILYFPLQKACSMFRNKYVGLAKLGCHVILGND